MSITRIKFSAASKVQSEITPKMFFFKTTTDRLIMHKQGILYHAKKLEFIMIAKIMYFQN